MQRCRACSSQQLFLFLALGEHPIANQFVLPGDPPEPRFALDAYVCLDCALIQIPDRVPAEFFTNYLYVTSGADELVRHLRSLATQLASPGVVPEGGLVVDIGCNEGIFLESCASQGLRVLGIDPAENLAPRARARGIPVVCEYFGERVGAAIRESHGGAAVVVTTNTFNHIDDLHDFVRGVAALLADDGVFIVEVPHAGELVEQNEFDTIYHEHLSEFSVRSMVELYEAVGMQVVRVEPIAIHGGSMRVFGQRRGGPRAVDETVEAWVARERERGLFERDTYERFRARVEDNREKLVAMLADLRATGKTVAAYGAPAKGNTLLNYCRIGPDILDFVADRNPLKQGRLTPGMHVPVVPVARVLEAQPDYLLVLAWNFADEVFAQQAEYARRGGRFIVPIPVPRIVG